MSKFAILLNGDIVVTQRLLDQVSDCEIIAADSGIRNAEALGLNVDLWVGDFDSTSAADYEKYKTVSREAWSEDKDLTDGEIALAAAVRRNASSIVVVGAFGGRIAHIASNMHLGFGFDGQMILTSGEEEAMPVKNTVTPDWPGDINFSILAFDDLEGVSITGAKWPLDNVTVPAGSGWTISNVVSQNLEVSVKSGRALLVGELSEK